MDILAARGDTPYRLLEQKLGNADDALEPGRCAGDAVLEAFFTGKKRRERESRREEYAALRERAVAQNDLEADLILGKLVPHLPDGRFATPFSSAGAQLTASPPAGR